MATISQQVLSDIAEISGALDKHIAFDKASREKIDAMYKIIVTGNGVRPLPEIVRNHDDWIECQKEADKKSEARQFDIKKGIIMLAAGEVLTLIVGAAAVILKK